MAAKGATSVIERDVKSLDWGQLLRLGEQCSGLPYDLLLAVIWVESRGNPNAININGVGGFSPKTAYDAIRIMHTYNNSNVDIGLMQINYKTWKDVYKVSYIDLLNPAINICIGAKILKQYLDEHNWSWRGVGRYNAVSYNKQVQYAEKIYKTLKVIKRWQEQQFLR